MTKEITQLQTRAIFYGKGRMTKVAEPRAQRIDLRAMENYSQAGVILNLYQDLPAF